MGSSILDLDIGNTRTKWRISGSERLQGVVSSQALDNLGQGIACPVGRVRIACVADEFSRENIRSTIKNVWHCEPEFARSQLECTGLHNAYEEHAMLGVDRWLAALAAWTQAGGTPCLVVDAGSALTIDTIDDKGWFLGGYIIPGIAMMRRALVSDTGLIRYEQRNDFPKTFSAMPANTAQAVEWGTAFAACAVVRKAREDFLHRWSHGTVRVTGGDGLGVAEALAITDTYSADLVLDGLALALP